MTADAARDAEGLDALFELMGEEVCVLAAEWPRELDAGDIDCAVRGLDRLWPLRLPPDCRLVQSRHYDIDSWTWTIERNGRVLPFDCLDDPHGIARYKFPTSLVECGVGVERLPPAAVRAAYLTIKRLRKGAVAGRDWETIREIAMQDRPGYDHLLKALVGKMCAARLSTSVTAGRGPDGGLRLRALSLLRLRRFRNPLLAAEAIGKGAARWFTRWSDPTGLVVVVAGPDGVGKSTLAAQLPSACAGGMLFLRDKHAHWRPGLLPSLGSLVGSPAGDAARPHGRPPHRPLVSAAALVYYWVDFLLGDLALFAPFKARTGLVVQERGWWDMLVDPNRYRLQVPSWAVRTLGRMLPQPDLVIVLEAGPDVLLSRKSEVKRGELIRQTRSWREAVPARVRRVHLDASGSPQDVRMSARDAVVSALADRAARRIGPGWVRFPIRSATRWTLPRGPRGEAGAGFCVYQPIAWKARLAWQVGKTAASMGLLRLLPRGEAPPEAVRRALAPYVPPRCTLSILRANHPGRYVVSIVGTQGRVHAVAKIATDAPGAHALEVEARNIDLYAGLLAKPLRAPRILERAPGVLVLEPVEWIPRHHPSRLPGTVAHALGRAFARSLREGNEVGFAHGDCAPWNLLRSRDGWVLVDWEAALAGAPAFYDVFHYVIQGHVLLGRPSLTGILRHEASSSWVGRAIEAFGAGAGLDPLAWRTHLAEYLRFSAARMNPERATEARALAARERILRAMQA
jgi:hypothetical protein